MTDAPVDLGYLSLPDKVLSAIAAAGGAEPGSTAYACPLPECEWLHIEPPLGQAGNPMALASVFGPGVFAAHAANERLQRMEQVLADHVSTHPPAEWAPAMVKLRDRVHELESAAARPDRGAAETAP